MSPVERWTPCAPAGLTREQVREWRHLWLSPAASSWRLSRHESLLRRLCVLRAARTSSMTLRAERRWVEARLGLVVQVPEPVALRRPVLRRPQPATGGGS